MILVRRTLTKHGYPPDKQQKAIDTVSRQAELPADCLFEHNYIVILKSRKNYGKIRLCLLDADEWAEFCSAVSTSIPNEFTVFDSDFYSSFLQISFSKDVSKLKSKQDYLSEIEYNFKPETADICKFYELYKRTETRSRHQSLGYGGDYD